jgi:hypothetical protein
MTDLERRYKFERDAAVAHLRDMLASYDAPNMWDSIRAVRRFLDKIGPEESKTP